jgi:mannose-6-phosphate isomerase-like protein (cupin superfamily)
MSDLDHVSVAVSDYARSKAFYEAALAPLGITLIMEGISGAGFGRGRPQFWLRRSAADAITPVHVSFRADRRDDVASFHAAAVQAGGKDFGAPGIRAEYHPGYYGAFVLDLDGHNIEAVIHESPRKAIILPPGGGRTYDMGRLRAVFKADGPDTLRAYSVSEWWLDANTKGPGAHAHPEDNAYYVLEGVVSVLVDHDWIDADAGSFVLVPGGVTHDFENRSERQAGMLALVAPGGFEREMKDIVAWFHDHPAGDARIP